MEQTARPVWVRWLPLGVAVAFMAGILLRAGTSPLDLLRYAVYAVASILVPGTLVYRSLRRTARTLVEDLAMGAAVGLTLEIGGWALFSTLDLRGVVWLWPLLVLIPYAAVPRLRRHWWVRPDQYEGAAALGWSWTISGVVCFWTAYLAMVFLDRNPIVPTSNGTLQYLDLAYQLSLAGEAKHHFPVDLPQVAGDPLYYHWFAYGHMAMSSMVGHIDLPVVAMRLAIPALCALAILLTGVVGWRVSGKPMVGAVASVLFFAVGEFNFTHPVSQLFGTQATFVIWHGMSMIYSWVLLIALILPLCEIARREPGEPRGEAGRKPGGWRRGLGVYAVAGLLILVSSGAKASSLPVVAAALLFTIVVLWLARRRVHWGLVAALGLTALGQLFSTAAIFHFQTYGVAIGPMQGLKPFWAPPTTQAHGLVVIGVWIAFILNMLLRYAGIPALLWQRRLRLEPAQWLLVGGGIAGPALFLVFSQPSLGNEYFTRSGFAFGVIASAWGYVEVFERARLSRPAWVWLGVGGAVFAAVLCWIQVTYAKNPAPGDSFSPLVPLLTWAWHLTIVAVVLGLAWYVAGFKYPRLRRRGGLVLLTAVLLAGAPGLIMDEKKSIESPNGGAYALVSMPAARTDAARFVRDHSAPNDVVATNVHCLTIYSGGLCDPRSFWLSAYSERSVLVEGWGFAPRQANNLFNPFWDPDRLALNDEAFNAPTAAVIDQLKSQYNVRWLVVDRTTSNESPDLVKFATNVYDNGRVAVYELH